MLLLSFYFYSLPDDVHISTFPWWTVVWFIDNKDTVCLRAFLFQFLLHTVLLNGLKCHHSISCVHTNTLLFCWWMDLFCLLRRFFCVVVVFSIGYIILSVTGWHWALPGHPATAMSTLTATALLLERHLLYLSDGGPLGGCGKGAAIHVTQ